MHIYTINNALGKSPDDRTAGFRKSVEQVHQHEKNNTRRIANTCIFYRVNPMAGSTESVNTSKLPAR